MLKKLSEEIHKNNIEKGFYEDKKNIGEMLCLVHSEVSEALEADRKSKYTNIPEKLWVEIEEQPNDAKFRKAFLYNIKDTFEDEIADAMIRLMDLAAYKGIDIERHIRAKVRFNSLRKYKHGKKY